MLKAKKLAVMISSRSDNDLEGGGGSMEEKHLDIETQEVAHSVVVRIPACDKQRGLFARVQDFAGRFGVEQRGIERVPPDERTDTSVSKVGTLVRTLTTEKHETCASRVR